MAWPAGSTTSGNLWLNLSSTTAFSRHRSSAGKPIPCSKIAHQTTQITGLRMRALLCPESANRTLKSA